MELEAHAAHKSGWNWLQALWRCRHKLRFVLNQHCLVSIKSVCDSHWILGRGGNSRGTGRHGTEHPWAECRGHPNGRSSPSPFEEGKHTQKDVEIRTSRVRRGEGTMVVLLKARRLRSGLGESIRRERWELGSRDRLHLP